MSAKYLDVLSAASRVTGPRASSAHFEGKSSQVHIRKYDALPSVPSRGLCVEKMGLARSARCGVGTSDRREEKEKEQEIRGGTQGATEKDSGGSMAAEEGSGAQTRVWTCRND